MEAQKGSSEVIRAESVLNDRRHWWPFSAWANTRRDLVDKGTALIKHRTYFQQFPHVHSDVARNKTAEDARIRSSAPRVYCLIIISKFRTAVSGFQNLVRSSPLALLDENVSSCFVIFNESITYVNGITISYFVCHIKSDLNILNGMIF